MSKRDVKVPGYIVDQLVDAADSELYQIMKDHHRSNELPPDSEYDFYIRLVEWLEKHRCKDE